MRRASKTLHVVIGRQNAGKSTATRAIAAAVSAVPGRSAATIEMSDALKDAVAAVFGFDRELLRNETPEARAFVHRADPFWSEALGRSHQSAGLGFSPRVALQEVGLALRTTVGPSVWTTGVVSRALGHLAAGRTDVVVSGVRYPDEVTALATTAAARGHRVVLYCVRRPSLPALGADAPECERVVDDAQRTAMELGQQDTTNRIRAFAVTNPEDAGRALTAAVGALCLCV